MKVAIYIENGLTQLVLTAESDWEKSITKTVSEGNETAHICRNSFYHTQGGWVRQGCEDDSLIISITPKGHQ